MAINQAINQTTCTKKMWSDVVHMWSDLCNVLVTNVL